MLKKKTKETKNEKYIEEVNEDNSKYLPNKKKVMKENFFEEFIKDHKEDFK